MNLSNLNTIHASIIIEELIRNDIDYFVISPGSRSSALAIAVAENKNAKSIIVYDERSAAFHSLGYTKATCKPAVLICTSGSATANYLPAVVEADINHIPMIIISADRPTELRYTGANQTINQTDLLKGYTRFSFDLEAPNDNIPLKYILTLIDSIYNYAISNQGPVHLNIMFREPLAPIEVPYDNSILVEINKWKSSISPLTKYKKSISSIYQEDINEIILNLKNSKNPLFLIGNLPADTDIEYLLELINKFKIPVFADILSSVRNIKNNYIVNYYDQILLNKDYFAQKPDFILHIGSQFVSKRLLQFLDTDIEYYYVIKNHNDRHDPNNNITNRFTANYNSTIRLFIDKLSKMESKPNNHKNNIYQEYNDNIDKYLSSFEEEDANEVQIARIISENLNNSDCIFLSSSMPIRDMDMYSAFSKFSLKNSSFYFGINIEANRGASGIDGVLSTATGYMVGNKKDLTLVIGDLAFIHDMNALTMLNKLEHQLTIVLINNSGGGIFSFLPINDHKKIFEPYFVTPHNFNFSDLSKNFNIKYVQCKTNQEFKTAYNNRKKQIGEKISHLIIEVITDRENNLLVHKKLQSILSKLDK